ncbi:Ninja-family protein AFP3 [Platanthera guangdongensis]|uniref:Ninja-family protein n=1 Tax=Platanthera guangdongensis TaxID=2320717 RepID=A0ABR2LJH1_9ASPA
MLASAVISREGERFMSRVFVCTILLERNEGRQMAAFSAAYLLRCGWTEMIQQWLRIRRAVAEHKNHKSPSSPSESPRPKTVRDAANAAIGGGLGHPLGKNDGGRCGSGRIATEEMPLVSTRGDGRNGRRIQGFLYKCGWGEVRIVCVCHGSFLMPAEFVKHGGGGDVAHPLKHIIVNSSSSPPFL